MNPSNLFTVTFFFIDIFFFFFFFLDVKAQSGTSQQDQSQQQDTIPSSYRPSIAIVIGILAIMVSLTFLLFVYAKYCNLTPADFFNMGDEQGQQGNQARSRSSGIDKAIIDTLPFFQFSSLKGSKQGLECAVCLSRFDDTEVLRLLPKCKHAFHLDCIDKWLESHSSCPLCRQRVELEDISKFTFSNSMRFPRNPSDLREDSNLELFVCRELDEQSSSSRFSVGSSFRKNPNGDKSKKDELLIPEGCDDQAFLHKFKHKIIVSDVVFNNRWSDLNSSDLLSLNSEMLNAASSERFTGMEPVIEDGSFSPVFRGDMERNKLKGSKVHGIKRNGSISDIPSTSNTDYAANSSNASKFMVPSGKRSMSEITNISRFIDFGGRSRIKDSSTGENGAKEERVRKLWLPIARRTVQWFAGREKRSQSEDSKPELPSV
ncbi:hypothetical protein MRB53_006577 [Persea americana]|uniref:Uncharacterized protein n=1 Tax=Persea americana TaxID=3435 RepID=A0ACC2MGI5_PERAE|nr:hypothetical protein MRB53_006577 [Persea americana]|eukprot:TRINITY_DN3658_c0_g1_i1.p1 TRINITY_DN3658_c0_g1~~TRINITY_DN3658_c0_g1_i1.p1  ORF type:complete len:431 (-),score=80.08 TRINITY_DN3658_c0_g1_i1:192-1484(-)